MYWTKFTEEFRKSWLQVINLNTLLTDIGQEESILKCNHGLKLLYINWKNVIIGLTLTKIYGIFTPWGSTIPFSHRLESLIQSRKFDPKVPYRYPTYFTRRWLLLIAIGKGPYTFSSKSRICKSWENTLNV